MTDDLERRLREGLHREAERITPSERRAEILAMAHNEAQHDERGLGEPSRRWLVPVSAAASVALIGAVVWGVSNSGGSQQAAPAAPTTSATAPPVAGKVPTKAAPKTAPSAAPNKGPAPATVRPPVPAVKPPAAGSSNGLQSGATTQVALPAYFVGSNSAAGTRFGLYREFVGTAVPVGATPAQKAKAAVAVAMNAQRFSNIEPYIQPWSGTSVTNLTVTPSRITITLSGPGASGFTAAQTKLAVQELVWTAQAALGNGATPVRFVIANGSTKLFGTYPTAQTYNRPAADQQFEVLAPIWIISPVRDQAFPAGAPVVASGQSCAFEATTQWQLKKSGKLAKSGVATASSGCPTRGNWQVKLGKLAAGSYTFRMYEVSQEGGGVVAETTKPFTVR
jgi:hypothetical protein